MKTSLISKFILSLTALIGLAAVSFGQGPNATNTTVGNASTNTNIIEVSDQKPGSVLVFPFYKHDEIGRAHV